MEPQDMSSEAANSRMAGEGRVLPWIKQWGVLVAMCIIAFVTLFPLIWMIITSLKTEAAVSANPLNLIPNPIAWGNYLTAWNTLAPFFRNSVILAALAVFGVLVVSSLAGYGFARLEFPGKNIAFTLVLATAIVPGIVYIVPQYIMFQNIGWIDTLYPLWVPKALTPVFGTFLMRQAFMTLPRELEDAALIDGASRFQVFFSIMLPQTKPALAAVGIFTFIESWNDLFGPLIFINSTDLQTLPMALAQFQGDFFTSVSILMAASTITVIPVIGIYLFAQKYFVQAITSTGMKG
jgi:ABC-type glycerol-3-phosphate transport system permease component